MSFMKFRTIKTAAMLWLAGALLWQNGCGGSSVNTVVDTVSPPSATVIAGTVQTFSSTVTGSTTTTSQWNTCSYVYTPLPTTAVPNPVPVTAITIPNCASGTKVPALNNGSLGTWTSTPTSATNVLTYTAPTLANFPNPIPTITFTATADANHSKTGTATVFLDTGIRVSITPSTATAPVGLNPAQQVKFTASFLNVPPVNPAPMWKVEQPVAGDTTDFPPSGTANPQGASCSPSCGTISDQGVFTAPATMPTNTSPKATTGSTAATAATQVTVVAWSPSDTSQYAVATITLVNSSTNPLTFTGIHPTTIAAGGVLQDVFLDAKNILNTTPISFTPPGPNQSPQVIDPSQIFTIPISLAYCTPVAATSTAAAVTCDASIMTRIRLNAAQLANAGSGQVTVSNIPDPNNPGQTKAISFPINLVYASPAIVSAVPDSYPQGVATQFSTDGGYYGGGNSPIVNLLFDGNLNIASSFNARQFTGPLQGSQIPSPGLYPVSIVSNAPQGGLPPFNPPPYPTVTTNVAVQPVFAGLASTYNPTTTPPPPQVYPPNIPLSGGATASPSSIAINSTKGYAVITEQGANAVEIVNFVPNTTLAGRYMPQLANQVAVGNQPTSVAIDDQIDLTGAGFSGQDLGVVVNSTDYTLTLLALPSGHVIGSPISLAGLVQEPSGTTAPTPYAVGVDPTTHYAVVAFSNAFVGFIVDVNPNPVPSGVTPHPCFISTQTVPCAIAAVSLNTGASPQVVMQPNTPLAYVTPGGAGVTSVVNLLLTNNSVPIAAAPNGAVCTNDVVTITTPVANGLNPSSPGTVLIAGVTPADLNGTYNVTSVSTYTFTYTHSGSQCVLPNGSTSETGGGGTVTYGNPYYTFSTTSTATGGAINPVTRDFAFADPNASTAAPQIAFIHQLDQTVTSLFLTRGSCNGCTPTPAGAPETGVQFVAWDPFVNVLIAYNPKDTFNEISLINPGGPIAIGSQSAYRIIAAIPTGQTGSYTASGTSNPTVFGPMGYDPKTNLVLVANAGSNTLTYLDLDPQSTFKKVQIQDVQLQLIPFTSTTNSGGVPSSQPPLASVTAPNAAPVAICDPTAPTNNYATCLPHGVTVGQPAYLRVLGQGFLSGGTPIVRLDGDPTGITVTPPTVPTDSEIDVTVAASRLTNAHDFALDVVSGSVNSNTNDLFAVQITPLAACGTTTAPTPAQPEGVAFDIIANVAVVTNFGCNTAVFINMDATNAHNYGVPYGSLLATVNTGVNPVGVDVIPRLGYAVTANNGDSSATIIQYGGTPFTAKALSFTSTSCVTSAGTTGSTNTCVGVSPTGVAIDQDRALALVANTGGNSLTDIDLTPLLLATPPATLTTVQVPTSGPPTAIAVDPNRAIAVVTNIQNSGTTAVHGGLDVINIAAVPPTKSTAASINSLTANPTGIVYDPVPNPALFYAASTQQNAIYSFNPDTGSAFPIRVGVNPYSVAYNYQTGTLLTVNSTSNTSSVIDAVNASSSVFATRETLGISSLSQFAVAIDNFTNTAVVADQNNNRILILPLPK
jgi:hypothetical protein